MFATEDKKIYEKLLAKQVDHELKLVVNQNYSIVFRDDGSVQGLFNTLKINKIFDDIMGEPITYGPIKANYSTDHYITTIDGKDVTIHPPNNDTFIGYETKNKICIVEAKMKPYEDFNIRQLYYPYRELHKVVGNNKEIFCLYIFRDKNQVIHIYKFEWENYRNMLDIKNTGYYTYKIVDKKKKKGKKKV